MRILIDTTNPSDALAVGMESPATVADGGYRLVQDRDGWFTLTGLGGEILMDPVAARALTKMITDRLAGMGF